MESLGKQGATTRQTKPQTQEFASTYPTVPAFPHSITTLSQHIANFQIQYSRQSGVNSLQLNAVERKEPQKLKPASPHLPLPPATVVDPGRGSCGMSHDAVWLAASGCRKLEHIDITPSSTTSHHRHGVWHPGKLDCKKGTNLPRKCRAFSTAKVTLLYKYPRDPSSAGWWKQNFALEHHLLKKKKTSTCQPAKWLKKKQLLKKRFQCSLWQHIY